MRAKLAIQIQTKKGLRQGDPLSLFAWSCLAYKPWLINQQTIFFSHIKSTNNTFSHGLSAKQAQTNMALMCGGPTRKPSSFPCSLTICLALVQINKRPFSRPTFPILFHVSFLTCMFFPSKVDFFCFLLFCIPFFL